MRRHRTVESQIVDETRVPTTHKQHADSSQNGASHVRLRTSCQVGMGVRGCHGTYCKHTITLPPIHLSDLRWTTFSRVAAYRVLCGLIPALELIDQWRSWTVSCDCQGWERHQGDQGMLPEKFCLKWSEKH